MNNVLNQASEDQRITFYRNSFKSFDANKDGFVTSNEFNINIDFLQKDNVKHFVDFETYHPFAYLENDAMTEILKQKYKIWGYYPTKIAITFKDYKEALEKKLEEINGKKIERATPAGKHRCKKSSLLFIIIVLLLFIIIVLLKQKYF